MVKARKYVVKKVFEGLPKRDDYEIVEEELPPIQDGEILVKTEWVSVDPYLRGFFYRNPIPFEQHGFQVGVVEDSKDPRFPVGTRVVSHKGWRDYYVTNVDNFTPPFDRVYKLPDLKGLPNSLGVGAVGMPGASAYFGFLNVCKPKAGETVVVTAAAGAIGSLVGQIAKLKGCKVIGFAGSEEKVQWLKEIGFDKAFNYKTVDVTAALKEAAPEGIDIYFDNVGGEISSLIIHQMRDHGRVSVCGCISVYNEDPTKLPKASILQPTLVFRQVNVQGFAVRSWVDRWPEAFADLVKWIKSGEVKAQEHITEGFENIYDAFVGVLNGENIGKAVVKI